VLPPPPVPFTRAGIEAAALLKDSHHHTFVCFCDLGTSVAVMDIFLTFLYLTISVVDFSVIFSDPTCEKVQSRPQQRDVTNTILGV
jgi:hypothetical protein